MALQSHPHRRLAWALALLLDALQMGLLVPTLGASAFVTSGLDLLGMIAFWRLLGWHWAFLPSFCAELIPWVDVAPFWTLAVLIATRRGYDPRSAPGAPRIP